MRTIDILATVAAGMGITGFGIEAELSGEHQLVAQVTI